MVKMPEWMSGLIGDKKATVKVASLTKVDKPEDFGTEYNRYELVEQRKVTKSGEKSDWYGLGQLPEGYKETIIGLVDNMLEKDTFLSDGTNLYRIIPSGSTYYYTLAIFKGKPEAGSPIPHKETPEEERKRKDEETLNWVRQNAPKKKKASLEKKASAFGEMAMEKQMDQPVEVSTLEEVAMNDSKEKKPSNPMLNSKTIEGMDSVERTFSGFLVPVARYALTAVLKAKNPQILSNGNLAMKATSTDIETDVGKVEAAADGVNAIYNDMVVTATTHYGDYIIKCYAKERKQAQDWMAALEQKMLKENQYRGKCLHVENGSVIFRKVSATMWDDVILDENIKRDIRMNTVAFLGDEKMAKVKVGKRGIIMYGEPGTGKTSAVKAVFNELEGKGVSRIFVTAESFRRMSAGSLFDLLPYLGKCVVAFEDIDLISGGRNDMISVNSSLLGDLLTNLDGMRTYADPVVIMASTNKISALDEALGNRPGRFDRKIHIGLPSEANLRTIYKRFSGLDVTDEVLGLSKGFTGSHVVETINTARILAAHETKELSACMKEAVDIIRGNFFPMQTTASIKFAARRKIASMKKAIKDEEYGYDTEDFMIGDKVKFIKEITPKDGEVAVPVGTIGIVDYNNIDEYTHDTDKAIITVKLGAGFTEVPYNEAEEYIELVDREWGSDKKANLDKKAFGVKEVGEYAKTVGVNTNGFKLEEQGDKVLVTILAPKTIDSFLPKGVMANGFNIEPVESSKPFTSQSQFLLTPRASVKKADTEAESIGQELKKEIAENLISGFRGLEYSSADHKYAILMNWDRYDKWEQSLKGKGTTLFEIIEKLEKKYSGYKFEAMTDHSGGGYVRMSASGKRIKSNKKADTNITIENLVVQDSGTVRFKELPEISNNQKLTVEKDEKVKPKDKVKPEPVAEVQPTDNGVKIEPMKEEPIDQKDEQVITKETADTSSIEQQMEEAIAPFRSASVRKISSAQIDIHDIVSAYLKDLKQGK